MTAETLTIEDVHKLINDVLASVNDRTYSLAEVAERTGFSLVELQRDCQKGLIEHTWRGRQRRMTPRQVALLIDKHRCGGPVATADASPPKPVDDLAAVRTATAKSAAKRATPKRRAAA